MPYDIGGQTLPSDPTGPKILNLGVYLCHPILAGMKRLIGPLFFPPSQIEIKTLLSAPYNDDTTTAVDKTNIVIRGYLGIGATWTVFPGLTGTGIDVAVKYSAPELYPSVPCPGQWDRHSVQEAIAREMSVLARLEQLDAAGSTTTRCAPRWLGCWTQGHRALGQVWCSVMEAGGPVGNMTEVEKQTTFLTIGINSYRC